ncbi:MAG: TlpA disulfide reductase family protein, partial [Myxococcota bacterium]
MNYLPLPFAVVVLCLGGCDTTDEEPSSSRSEAVVPEAVVPQAAVPEVQTEPRLDDVTAESVGALLREQPGKVLMVNMWSTWCEPCVEEFPELVAVSQEYREQGVGMLFISA